jgi:hypothetical protein
MELNTDDLCDKYCLYDCGSGFYHNKEKVDSCDKLELSQNKDTIFKTYEDFLKNNVDKLTDVEKNIVYKLCDLSKSEINEANEIRL